MKVLSVIVPAYNCEKVIDKCITSFLDAPCFEKIELIIVNDGSTDNTIDVARKYTDKHTNIKLISQENKGHGGALNTGCAAAEGKYLKVIDADDWVSTENLETFINKLEKLDSDVVLTHHYTNDISNGEIKLWKSYPKEFEVPYNFDEIMVEWDNFNRSLTFHGITYNTKFYKENCISLSQHVFYEDYEFATIPCCFAKSVTPIDLFIYNYRIGDVTQSVSKENQLKRISHTETVLRRLIKEFDSLSSFSESAKKYYCTKAQELLLSYLTTACLVEPNKSKGRRLAKEIMATFKNELPIVYKMAQKKYFVFKALNFFHISKDTFEAILNSKFYSKIRSQHEFN